MKQSKLLNVLGIILLISCGIFIYNYQTVKHNLFPHNSSLLTQQNGKNSQPTFGYTISSECPNGTDKMIKESNVFVKEKIITCHLSDEKYRYYSEEMKVWSAGYESYIFEGDIGREKYVRMLQKHNGDLFLDPGLAGLQRKIISGANKNIEERIGGASGDHISYSVNDLNKYMTQKSSIYGPNDDGQYCGDFDALSPLSGTFTTCVGFGDDYESVNHGVYTISGIPVYLAAREIAKTIAKAPYINKVDYKNEVSNFMSAEERIKVTGTFLGSSVVFWSYHSTGGGYWLFQIRETLGSFKVPRPTGFNDLVLVKVQNDKKACILETKPGTTYRISTSDRDAPCE